MKKKTSPTTNSMNRSPLRYGFLLIPFVLACFALSQTARAVCRDGCSDIDNTFLGEDALLNNTGLYNTAIGWNALYSNSAGIRNTAIGMQALLYNTTGNNNTASGLNALLDNTTGNNNTANGIFALLSNTTGHDNTAIGSNALYHNTTGVFNIALGANAGFNLTTGGSNIDIFNRGVAGESNTIRIGKPETHTATFIAGINGATVPSGVGVIVDSSGHLGTVVSSERFKDEIKPMDKASESVLSLKPVTFRYKHELDPDGIPQFGLVAEDVEKVNSDLVARDDHGKPYSVRYEAVNAMLLNEFLKEHSKVTEQSNINRQQEATITELKAMLAEQQKEIKTLKAGLERVNDRLDATKSAGRLATNNE